MAGTTVPFSADREKGVRSTHADYRRMSGKWQRCRDAAGGQDSIHAAGERYIPKLRDQANEDYRAYIQRAPFYNASYRTIAGLVGMLFRKPPALEVPAGIEPYMGDITASGVPLHLFVQDVAEEALTVGRVGILVDFPQSAAEGVTVAAAEQNGLRPMMQSYDAECIYNWRVERINNASALTMVALKETASTFSADGFTETVEDRYRVLDLVAGVYRVRLFKIDDNNKDVLLGETMPLLNGSTMDFVPFIFVGTDDVTPEVDEPPLIDLIDMNISHYRTTADYENACHFAGSPTAVICGYTPETPGEKLYIGSATAWVFPNENAKASYLEISGTGLPALQASLDRKEQQMAVLGARMLEALKRGVESAQTASIHRVGEQSMLSSVAQCLSIGITKALRWMADWSGAAGDVSFELNRDFFPAPMDYNMLTSLIAGWQAGAYSYETLFENLKQGEIIGPDATAEEEQSAIDIQPPAIAQAGAPKPAAGAPANG